MKRIYTAGWITKDGEYFTPFYSGRLFTRQELKTDTERESLKDARIFMLCEVRKEEIWK